MTLIKCKSYFLTIAAVFSVINAFAQFLPNREFYVERSTYDGWDKIYQNKIKKDSAYIYGGTLLYYKTITDSTASFIKYFPNGKIHIEATDCELNKKKQIKPFTGNWVFYSEIGKINKEIGFKYLRRKYLRTYDAGGNLIMSKTYPLKWTYGIGFGYQINNLMIKSENPNSMEFLRGLGFEQMFYLHYHVTSDMHVISSFVASFQVFEFDQIDPETNKNLLLDFTQIKLPVGLSIEPIQNVEFSPALAVAFNFKNKEDEVFSSNTFYTKNVEWYTQVALSYNFKLESFLIAPGIQYSYQLNNLTDSSQPASFSTNFNELHKSIIQVNLSARGLGY